MPVTNEAKLKADALKINIERLNYLDSMLNKWVEDEVKERFVTKIMRYGVPIFEGAYGDLGRDGKPLLMDTIYPVASNTKPIIAALLLILQEDGLVDLTDPVSQYLGDYVGDGREKIAIWHFLTHSSGINDEDFRPFVQNYVREKFNLEIRDDMNHEQWLEMMLDVHKRMALPTEKNDNDAAFAAFHKIKALMPLTREPRSHMFYCNFGYQKCKEIITTITEESIDSYASRKLFQPLGMIDSHFVLPEQKWDRVVGRSEQASGYSWLTSPECFVSESGAGGLKTTAVDILKFAEMIRNDGIHEGKRVMSKFSVREMKTNHNKDLVHNHAWNAWTMGFNIKSNKKDDAGDLRPSTALDHGGFGGVKFHIDSEQGLTYANYAVDIADKGYNIFGRFSNILYTALAD